MRRKSPAPHGSREPGEAPLWLRDRVYLPKRQRTVDLVTASVDTLLKEGRRVSLATVVAKSRELDAAGTGISESAILGNADARAYYQRHRTWRGAGRHQAPPAAPRATWLSLTDEPGGTAATPEPVPGLERLRVPRVKAERDVARARRRYLRMGKPTLVDRLLAVEQAAAAQEERWLRLNDELLLWMLLVEHLLTHRTHSS